MKYERYDKKSVSTKKSYTGVATIISKIFSLFELKFNISMPVITDSLPIL